MLLVFNLDSVKKEEDLNILNYVKDNVKGKNVNPYYGDSKKTMSDSADSLQATMISQLPQGIVKLSKKCLPDVQA